MHAIFCMCLTQKSSLETIFRSGWASCIYMCVCVCVCEGMWSWMGIHTLTLTHTQDERCLCVFFLKRLHREHENVIFLIRHKRVKQSSEREDHVRRTCPLHPPSIMAPTPLSHGSLPPFAVAIATTRGNRLNTTYWQKKKKKKKRKAPYIFFFFCFCFFTFWMLTALKMKLNLVEQQQHSSSSSSRFSVKDWKQIYSLDLSLFLWCMGEVLHKSVTAHKVVPFYLQFI